MSYFPPTPVLSTLAAGGSLPPPLNATVASNGFSLPSIGNVATDLPFAAAGAGGGGGFWSGLSVPSFLGGSTPMGLGTALGRVAPWSLAGLAAKTGINAIAPGNSTADVLGNLAAGAGVGAGVGSLFGPGPGTAIGAGVGALVGGGGTILANIFGGDDEGNSRDVRDTLAAQARGYGLDPAMYTGQFDTLSKLGAKDAQGNKLSNQDIALQLAGQMAADRQTTLAKKEQYDMAMAQHEADLKYGLALQSQARDFFSPYTNNIVAAGASQAAVLNSLADQMPGAYKGVFQAQAANALNTSQQLAGAYAAQVALMPAQMAMAQSTQASAQQVSDLNRIYTLAAQMKGPQGAGVDFSQLGAGQ